MPLRDSVRSGFSPSTATTTTTTTTKEEKAKTVDSLVG